MWFIYYIISEMCLGNNVHLNRLNHMRGGIKPQFMRVFIDAIMIICEFGYSLAMSKDLKYLYDYLSSLPNFHFTVIVEIN